MVITSILEARGSNLYRQLLKFVQDTIEFVKQGEQMAVAGVLEISKHIIEDFKRSTRLLESSMSYYDPVDLVVSHAVNVAVYSLKMAQDMGLSEEEVEDITAVALLHDIGFGHMPLYNRNKDDLVMHEGEPDNVISDEDRDLISKHPEAGYETILKDTPRATHIAEIILQHHERADGTGFPRGLTDSEQLLQARIIAIMDVYEAFIHPRPFRDALVPPKGIDAIRQSSAGAFSSQMIKELLLSFSICPIGHIVKLSDNSIGKVIRTHRDYPMRPVVRLYVDSSGRKLYSPLEISLKENVLLYISECLPRFSPDSS